MTVRDSQAHACPSYWSLLDPTMAPMLGLPELHTLALM